MTSTDPASRMVMLAVILVAFAAGGHSAQGSQLQDLRDYSLELVNSERQEVGLPPLSMDETLIQSAEAHAQDMLERDYFSHVSPEGEDVMDRYLAAGGGQWRLVTENIGYCAGCPAPPSQSDIERQHEDWMQSSEHRANILSQGIDSYGLGLAAADGDLYAVQNFAGPGRPLALAEDETAEPLPREALAAMAADLVNDQRAEHGLSPLEVDEVLVEAADGLVPDDLDAFVLDDISPMEAIPEASRGNWRQVVVVAGECGGCGVEPTDADVRYFIGTWLEEPQYRELLLDAGFDALGLVIRADGEGRKIAVALLGSPEA